MQWSSLKSKVEAFFAPSVKGRVELRAASYRGAHDQTGRGYITVDGKEIWNMCTLSFWGAEYPRIDFIAQEQGVSARAANASLCSTNPLIKSLAMLDSRTGKRRLEKLDLLAEHPMVHFFFKLRCEAEGISLTSHSSRPAKASG